MSVLHACTCASKIERWKRFHVALPIGIRFALSYGFVVGESGLNQPRQELVADQPYMLIWREYTKVLVPWQIALTVTRLACLILCVKYNQANSRRIRGIYALK